MRDDFEPRPPTGKPFDAVGFGLNAVDHLITVPHYPAFNTKVQLREYVVRPGGQVATAMVALARLGCRTRYIGKVGDDEFGRLQLRSLAEAGVEHSQVKVVPGATSQLAFILIDEPSGERTIIWGRDPRLIMRPEELEREAITSGRVLHLDGHDVAAAIQAARWAREAGIPVVIDLDNFYPGVEELLPLVDYLITSAEFPKRFLGIAEPEEALRALKRRYQNPFVAITLGDQGAIAYCHGVFIHSPAFRVPCRDTTGAGDAFRGGFIYGLLNGLSVTETLRFANAVAGLNCRGVGARGGLPTLAEVQELLRTQ
jgi:sugar/nucleoside kinase (ribokinase family)